MGHFATDEERGSVGEQFVIEYYKKEGYPNIWKKQGKFSSYDLVIPAEDVLAKHGELREITIEVKTDKESARYGNFAIESHRESKNDKTTELTGINVCTADFWAHIIMGAYWGLYIMPTDALRKYAFDPLNNFPIKKGGDDKRTHNVCIPILKILNQDFCQKAKIDEQDFNQRFSSGRLITT